MPVAEKQLAALRAPLDSKRVSHRVQANRQLAYLEGHDVIDAANAIFGYDGWSYRVARLECTAGVWLATVTVTVDWDASLTVREDVGCGIPATPRGSDISPEATETAVKAAVTDGLKRALRTFGNAFGNSLYDKEDPLGQQAAPATNGVASNGHTAPAAAPATSSRKARIDELMPVLEVKLGTKGAQRWLSEQIRAYGRDRIEQLGDGEYASLLTAAKGA